MWGCGCGAEGMASKNKVRIHTLFFSYLAPLDVRRRGDLRAINEDSIFALATCSATR